MKRIYKNQLERVFSIICCIMLFNFGSILNGQSSGDELCFKSSTNDARVGAKITWTIDPVKNTVTLRTTFAKTFVDNTYGTTAIGWPNGHKFGDLVGSDHVQLALYDKNGVKKLEFKQDYITASSGASSGYDCLGVTGGEGQMLTGSASSIKSATTSLDVNFNTYGYVLTTNSPSTDANYTPNPSYPNWIYDVWYETTVDLNAFGSAGFGFPLIASVHASPSKTGNNTEPVDSMKCPSDLSLVVNGNCVQDCSEDIVSTMNGTNTPFTYLWSTGATTKDLNNVCAGTYTLTVTDSKGKKTSATAVVKDDTCPGDQLCFKSSTGDKRVNAKIDWTINPSLKTVTIRTTFAKTFVDNTYGSNTIGWPANNHSFSQLVGSDHVQLALYDNNKVKKLEFKLDYITASSAAPSGYDCLGVTGGDGGMITGSASSILSATSSMDVNFNTYNYVLTTNSPATDTNYTPNPSYPKWIYEVWYETTVDLNVFGTSGFGVPVITSVHASPSKTGNNTEPVDSTPCNNCVFNSMNVTPGTCNPNTNTFTLSGSVSFTQAPSTGTLTLQIAGGENKVFNAPFTSPVNFSFANQNSDGLTHTVTATFSADPNCTKSATFNSPASCIVCPNNACVSDNLVVNGNMSVGTPPSSWVVANGTPASEWTLGTGSSTGNFGILNNDDDNTDRYIEQYVTTGINPNTIYTLKALGATHSPAFSNAIAEIYLELYNGNTLVGTSNKSSTTFIYNGSLQAMSDVLITTTATTTKIRIVGHSRGRALKLDNIILTACNPCQCIVSGITATAGTCNPSTNMHTVSGVVTFTNPPNSGTLTIQVTGGGSQVINAPFSSPFNYSLANQNSDGLTHTVTAVFSADPNCTKSTTFTAPDPCISCPNNSCVTDNLDINGNMSAGSPPSSWVVANGTPASEWTLGTGSSTGNFGILNNDDDNTDRYIEQYITTGVIPNTIYTLKALGATHSPAFSNAIAEIYLELYNGNTLISTSSKSNTTYLYNGSLAALTDIQIATTSNTTKIRIVGHSRGRALKLDNIVLTACIPCVCSVNSITATPGACNSSSNTYTVTGSVSFTNPPSSGILTIQIAGGGSQIFNAPFASPVNYSIAGQISDGITHTISATFSADPNCTKSTTYNAPANCVCVVSSITATPGSCNPLTNTYSLTGTVIFTNAPATGILTVSITGGSSQTFNAPFTSPINYTINNQLSDGLTHTVTAIFSADPNCTKSKTYSAPPSCVCSLTAISATPGTCNSTTNAYTLTGVVTFTNPPTTGTLTIEIAGGGSQILNAPFTSPVNYSIANQSSDGSLHTVTATFSADPNCTKSTTYTSPQSCITCPNPSCVSGNLVVNGNMETGTPPSSWVVANGTPSSEWTLGTGSTTGDFGILNNDDDNTDRYIEQYITTNALPNILYTLNALGATHNPAFSNSIAEIYLEFYNGTTLLATSTKSNTTHVYDGTLLAMTTINMVSPANTNKIRVVGHSRGRAFKLDNIVLIGCLPCPCLVTGITVLAGDCNAVSNSYTLTGSVTFTNPPTTGTLTVQITGGGSQTFNAPFTSPLNYNIASQIADGLVHTVTAAFSAEPNCKKSTTYTAPSDCTPKITHTKEFVSTTATGLNSYEILYRIVVSNTGSAGVYNLSDAPSFDNDITITASNYTTNAVGNPGNPGPLSLLGSGPWNLATNQSIGANATQTYNLKVAVIINLEDASGDNRYDECGKSLRIPKAGEGLFNESRLDVNLDGVPDARDTACADLPYLVHEKSILSVTQTGARSFQVAYKITVRNIGGVNGVYALSDRPAFDNDIVITGSNYTSDAPGNIANPGPVVLGGSGPWSLANGQAIVAGGVHMYIIKVNVSINMEDAVGDNRYDRCGKQFNSYPVSGEGLFNESRLDINNDGTVDQKDTACADIPYIVHNKSLVGVTDLGGGNFRVIYRINVSNMGGANGVYDLQDAPGFDDDVNILSATYTTDASGNVGNPGPSPLIGTGPWVLATNQSIGGFSNQTFQITVNVNVDLTNATGDNIYKPCGYFNGIPRVGEGLFNESRLFFTGIIIERDTACADIPKIVHNKMIVGVTPTGVNSYQVEYKITVENKGGAPGLYSLTDAPNFDNDINILSASFSSNAAGNIGNPGPVGLPGTGPWTLATNQSIAGGGIQTYNIKVNVSINLNGGGGDDRYEACGHTFGTYPKAGEGLFNESRLDINSDGIVDQRDTACADLPYLVHEKSILSVTQTGARSFQVAYKITVRNIGGTSGVYALSDRPAFDNDIVINSTSYTSDAAGNNANPGPVNLTGTGPWILATNQTIAGGGVQMYVIKVNVSINMEDAIGDNRYDRCGKQFNSYPVSGEGLFNESRLDINSDGTVDQKDTACADIPYITHNKSLVGVTDLGGGNFRVVYRINVSNVGGANGVYDLQDAPGFDDDVNVLTATYTTDASGNAGNPGPLPLIGAGPWVLATNQSIGGFSNQTYQITVNVNVDLANATGDNIYKPCGYFNGIPRVGEGLFNESRLYFTNFIIERDTACADIPKIVHNKTIVGVTPTGVNSYQVEYKITVENKGGAPGLYSLTDAPNFDNDINILSASYSSNAAGNIGNPGPVGLPGTGPWTLATNQTIAGGGIQTYNIKVNVSINLSGGGGDDRYDACGHAFGTYPKAGEGLFNESRLDINSDGTVDERDTACADIPFIVHDKSIIGLIQIGPRSYQVIYKITVRNIGGTSAMYALSDRPAFDNDIAINSASYSSDAPGNIANPGPVVLPGVGPWSLSANQTILSGAVHVYSIRVNVTINLEDASGDNRYDQCGKQFGSYPISGEGLFNESRLDINSDGTVDQKDTACADLPYIIHEKSIVGVTDLGGGNYRVIYRINVNNIGAATGTYDLTDAPNFDDDVSITSASYTTNAVGNPANPGPWILFGSGPWFLANDQSINGFSSQTYQIAVNVNVDLVNAGNGDNIYKPCGYTTPGIPRAGEGLFNESRLDLNNDGNPDQKDTACADIPRITHHKSIVGVTPTGLNSYQVEYKITVENKGGATGLYSLTDAPGFDNDINILSANYVSNATGNPANPGPVGLPGTGPWTLAVNQSISAGGTQTYNIRVNVSINLQGGGGDERYDACGHTFGTYPKTGEGLFNESRLDINSDGIVDQRDTACADLPYIVHDKSILSVTQTGARSFQVAYKITVRNIGGIGGVYALSDRPAFDNDIVINSTSYTSDAPGNIANPGPINLAGIGPWILATNQSIGAGGIQMYIIKVNIGINLEDVVGDNRYDQCGKRFGSYPVSGEGLFNESRLDINSDGTTDQLDTACADIPYIVHEKQFVGVVDIGGGNFRVVYKINVRNLGGATGTYDLQDAPGFDDDVNILSATYTTDASGNPGNPGPLPLAGNGPWNLAGNQSIGAFSSHMYQIGVNVSVDLVNPGPGDNIYRPCGFFNGLPRFGEGFFNESRLYYTNILIQRDTACGDIPKIVHNKSIVGVTPTGLNSYQVEYKITVENKGGAPGVYSLSDAPNFDNDIAILSANYSSNVPGHVANPGPLGLAGTGPWTLASNQSIAGGAIHTYNIRMNVSINLEGGGGDDRYDACGHTFGSYPKVGEGLFNESRLDINSDGIVDERDTACTDIPYLIHEKSILGVNQTGPRNFQVTYKITVRNIGGTSGVYALSDRPAFDNDIVIGSTSYTSDAPGNIANPGPVNLGGSGPWILATNQSIGAGGVQMFVIKVNVSINLSDAVGDNRYDQCGKQLSSYPISGEGLFNESRLDINSDGSVDQKDTVCADIPYIVHHKTIVGVTDLGGGNFRVVYRINVINLGGASGVYDLQDAPAFDDDVNISNANYMTDATGNPGNPGPLPLAGTGPWVLASNQQISAFGNQSYQISLNVNVDLLNATGDNNYRPCGFTLGIPIAGEGLFNQSRLFYTGILFQLDTACADIPKIIHKKSIVGVTPLGLNSYQVEYKITVENKGGANGIYSLYDAPNFDNDINILSATYSSNAPGNVANPGPLGLAGTGPWTLATNQSIAAGGTHTYNIRVNVSINLEGGGGDDRYDACGHAFGQYPKVGEGLFNESRLDINSDGIIDQRDTACTDIPYIVHEKSIIGLIQTGARSFQVTYKISVRNLGGTSGMYALSDRPAFDNDIVINGTTLTSDAPGNIANPGPVNLAGTGPWLLANNQSITGGGIHSYIIKVNVTINLEDAVGDNRYDQCGKAFGSYPISGEGLFNESRLDINSDGSIDQKDTVCADIPYIVHEKTFTGVTDLGGGNYRVAYQILVRNLGGASGTYDLQDAPAFDDDVNILNANYTSNATGNPGNPGPWILFGSGPWLLANNQSISAFGNQTYQLSVNVNVDLVNLGTGDNVYRPCGFTNGIPRVGEGFFNESRLYYTSIIIQRDTACGDIPRIIHNKSIVGVTPTGLNSFQVEYKITVENKGGAPGVYSLSDAPNFDNDITILAASYNSNAPGNVANPGPLGLPGSGPWILATNQAIAGGGIHTYNIKVNISINLNGGGGDDRYDACGQTFITYPKAGEGLFNESRLDINSDGTIDQRDTACADIPYLIHEKSILGVTQTGARNFQVTYKIAVRNVGAVNAVYALSDRPAFDNDITITGANYTSDAPGNIANPGPLLLGGTGPWTLANNQSIAGGSVHNYIIKVSVSINLEDVTGDNRYDPCGKQFGSYPISGEGLFNESRLDINSDGSIDQKDTACADIPYIVHEKVLVGVVDLGGGNYRAIYRINVTNKGGASGNYDMNDAPGFDDDVNILSASYTTDAVGNIGNPGPIPLFGTGPWVLATNQAISGFSMQSYQLAINVNVDLTNLSGDNIYRPCGFTNGIPKVGEGFFNESRLYYTGILVQRDTACGDIPKIIHHKSLVGITPLGLNSYQVEYKITVENKGGANGTYSLADSPAFDNDINILSASYSSTAPGNIANPGPIGLIGTGPWTLASNQSIAGGATHTFNIRVNVSINLNGGGGDDRYDACGRTFGSYPKTGEGLFNESQLDINSDGTIDQRDTACSDIPYLLHEKNLVALAQTGPRSFLVTYKISVRNVGGMSGVYALSDRPAFDNDIVINNSNYSSDAPGNIANPGPVNLSGTGPWLLANNQTIAAGAIQNYLIRVNVSINLEDAVGDNRYDKCGKQFGSYPISGEGLFNESRLDINSDGSVDQKDTACADIPYIVHHKSLVGITDIGNGNFRLIYKINVSNLGGSSGFYDLQDVPNFDNDVNILSSSYTTDAVGNLGNPGPLPLFGSGPWVLAANQSIGAFSNQTYQIAINVSVDLANGSGDNVYRPCGYANGIPRVGEGLFNESRLFYTGIEISRDTACGDIPRIIHHKTFVGLTPTGLNTYQVEYKITVENKGGANGTYSLTDAPAFDNDITILSANYFTNVLGNPGNPGPIGLPGTGPWTLASNQTIAVGAIHTYNIRVNVTINLNGGGGDDRYDACGHTFGSYPKVGEGLFNESRLDINSDGTIDQRDTACSDIPYITHDKNLIGMTQTGPRSFMATYRITVRNVGGVSGTYALVDRPAFDNDIVINSSNYTSDAPGNIANPGPVLLSGSGPWLLATNQTIAGGALHSYILRVNVTINLEDAVGDNRYDQCGKLFVTFPVSGEGLFNESSLDINSDGSIEQKDTACGDIPYLIHEKTVSALTSLGNGNFKVVYRIKVTNLGGVSTTYDLQDAPSYDDDINILNTSYTTDAIGNLGNPGPWSLIGTGPWSLANNQFIAAFGVQTYQISVNVNLDLTAQSNGDHIYRKCGATIPGQPKAGEGLFNESRLDLNRDGIPDQRDTACTDTDFYGALGDTIWVDLNGNGMYNIGEPVVKDVIAILRDCATGQIIRKDTTDVNGYYLFDKLTPNKDYFITFDLSLLPSNYGFTKQDQGGDDRLDSDVNQAGVGPCTHIDAGEIDNTYDVGLVLFASLGDYVWHDRNLNGMQDFGEEGIQSVTVRLYDANTKVFVKSTVTDINGFYLFTNLIPGDYYVKFDVPSGWLVTTANQGPDYKDSDVDNSNGTNTTASTQLSQGEVDRTWDLGLYKCTSISGDVWFDIDYDGIYDPAEKGINGLYVYVIDAATGKTVAATVTSTKPGTPSDDGYYKFICLKPGTYYIRFDKPSSLSVSPPYQGTNPDKDSDITHENGINTTRRITLQSGDNVISIGAGFQPKATLGRTVWVDANSNGIQDIGEAVLPGVIVSAYNSEGMKVSESITDKDGHYLIDELTSGDYFVKFELPDSKYRFTKAHAGLDEMDSDVDGTFGYGSTRMMKLLPGQNKMDVDAGVIEIVSAVDWMNLEGRYNGNFTELDWTTGVERDNDYFIIERRHEMEKEFTELGKVSASNKPNVSKHNYEFDDFGVAKSGVYYYRLKQVDKTGIYTYSREISINVDSPDKLYVFIYPNPVNDILKVDLWLPQDGEIEVSVFDQNGKRVLVAPFSEFKLKGKYNELLRTGILAPAQYVLQIKTAHELIQKKFTVSR